MSSEPTDRRKSPPSSGARFGIRDLWSLDRLRQQEQERSARYRGLAAAWHVWRADYGVAFGLFLLAIVISLVFLRSNTGGEFVSDDSYVTLKFAQNLLRYHRFTFDGGVGAAAAASPLHVILIALVSLITGRADVAVTYLGVLLLPGAAIAAFFWSREVTGGRRIGAVSGLLFVTSGWMIFDALSGLETVLFIMLIMLTLFLFEKRSIWFGVPAALSVMTRPDAWFFVAGIAGFSILEGIRQAASAKHPRRSLAVWGWGLFLLCLAPYLALTYAGTSSVLPGAALARTFFSAEIGLPSMTKLGLLWDAVKLFYMKILMPWPWLIVLGLVCARRFWTRFYVPIALGAFLLTYLLLFPGSLQRSWCRYQHVFIPFVMLAIAEGSFVLVRFVRRRLERPAGFRIPHAGVVLGFVIAGLLAVNQYVSLRDGREKFARSVKSVEQTGDDIARFIQRHTRKGDVIAAHDIGLLFFNTRLPILDFVGVVNSGVRQYYRNPQTGRLIPPDQRAVLGYILDSRPKYLVMFETDKPLLNFDADQLPAYFTFVGESKPPYPLTSGGYRFYAVHAPVGQ